MGERALRRAHRGAGDGGAGTAAADGDGRRGRHPRSPAVAASSRRASIRRFRSPPSCRAKPTSWRVRRVSRSRSIPPRTTRCSCMAAWGSARHISSRQSAITFWAPTPTPGSAISMPRPTCPTSCGPTSTRRSTSSSATTGRSTSCSSTTSSSSATSRARRRSSSTCSTPSSKRTSRW